MDDFLDDLSLPLLTQGDGFNSGLELIGGWELNDNTGFIDEIMQSCPDDESPNPNQSSNNNNNDVVDFVPGQIIQNPVQVPPNYFAQPAPDRNLQVDKIFTVDFNGTLRKWYLKKQHNVRKKEWYLENPTINVSICFSSAQARGMVEQVNFYVKKLVEGDPQNPLGDVPRLPISLEFHPTQPKIDVQLNIDSYHTYNNHIVFKLPTVQQTSPRKQFCVITEIKYCDEVQARRVKSPPFLVTTTPLSPQKQQQVPTNVAATQDAQFENVLTRHLEASTISADTIYLKSIQSKKGDTAYNFPQADPDVEFKEGEVVGIGIHPRRRNAQAVFRITTANIYTFRFFGVVSRSYYFQARAPPSNSSEKTETICMYGQVPIKVRGTVKFNDDIIPSATYPGYGEARQHCLKALWRQRSSEQLPVLGIALSTHDCIDTPLHTQGACNSCKESKGMVLAGVSLLDSANRFQIETKINSHTRELSKRNCRRLAAYFSISALVLGLVSILIWQLLPGSSLRRAMCEKDTLAMRCMFQYQSGTNDFFQPIVNGKQIRFKDLKERVKIHHLHPVCKNGKARKGMRYFLNIDQCTYGDHENPAETHRLRVKEFYGPYFFATDKECNEVYYWFTDIFMKHSNVTCYWRKYTSVNRQKWKNIQCRGDGEKRPHT